MNQKSNVLTLPIQILFLKRAENVRKTEKNNHFKNVHGWTTMISIFVPLHNLNRNTPNATEMAFVRLVFHIDVLRIVFGISNIRTHLITHALELYKISKHFRNNDPLKASKLTKITHLSRMGSWSVWNDETISILGFAL